MNSKFNYGAVLKLTREDDLKSIEMNLTQMKQSGFNTVVLWPAYFWWEEKGPDYPFATGKKVLEIAEKVGIKIVMELAGQLTAMEYAPDFLMKDEYYAVNEDGHREYGQNSFGFLNYYHPCVNRLVIKHFTLAAKAYKGYSALLAYDIFNETMFHSFDAFTLKQFRNWLKNKYKTINKLNAVWERSYGSFNQVSFERWRWMSVMPVADYNAFRRESMTTIVKSWYNALRLADDTHPIMADNVYAQSSPLGLYFRPQDDFGLKTAVDEIGMSFYPKQKNGTFSPALRHNIFDGFYSASRWEGFWLAEMQTHNQSVFAPTTCVLPAELKQWCLEAYSAGAKSLIYWMWRPFNKGLQTLGRGLVNYKNQATERLEVATELSQIFDSMGIIKPVKSKAAVLYDPINEDMVRSISCANDLEQNIYNLSIFGAYKAFLKNNVRVDVALLEDIKNYEVVILSNQIFIDKNTAEKLIDFVNGGGVIIADGSFGFVDETSVLNQTLPGGELNPLVGEELIDFDNENSTFNYKGAFVEGYMGRNKSVVTSGSVVSEFFDKLPAVTEKVSGKGKIITVNTSVWYGYASDDCESRSAEDFAAALIKELNLKTVSTDLDLTIRISENDQNYYIFAFNYSSAVQSGEITLEGYPNGSFNLSVPPCGTEIITLKKGENK